MTTLPIRATMLTKPKAQLTNGLPSLATTIKKQGEFETMKNVLILSGSPRKGGNSDLLCDEFMRGAKEMGVIYGTGVYEKGKVLNTPAMAEAYEMGKNV